MRNPEFRHACGTVALAAGLLIVELMPRGTTAAVIKYGITSISPLPGSNGAAASGIDAAGDVVGVSFRNGQAPDGFLLQAGTMINLGTVSGTPVINSIGDVAGVTSNGAAFLYSGGVQTPLAISGEGLQITAINNSGQVVGSYRSETDQQYHGFLYSHGVQTDLGAIGTVQNPLVINNQGRVAGSIEPGVPFSSAFVYENGIKTGLALVPGSASSRAVAINDWGMLAGGDIVSGSHAFVFDGSKLHDLGTFGGMSAIAYGINNSGQVVGQWQSSGDFSDHPFLYDLSTNTVVDLNSLLPPNTGWTIAGAVAINDSGAILAYGANSGGFEGSVILDPLAVPEPSILLAFGSTLFLACLARVLRKCRR